jgi:parallel beta-helix repeat protein
MNHHRRLPLGIVFTVFVMVLTLLPTVTAAATVGVMQITVDTTLTEDHNGPIEIVADSVTLDCDGHKVTGIGSGLGISMFEQSGVTIRDCDVSGFMTGIVVNHSTGNLVEDNHVHDNVGAGFPVGIEVRSSPNNIIKNNVVARNGDDGIHLAPGCEGRCETEPNSDGNMIEGNTATDNGRYGIALWYSDNNTISGNAARNNGASGFGIGESQNTTITNNDARNNGKNGFGIGGAHNTTFTNNEARSNGYVGFAIHDDSTATFTNNDAHRNGDWGFETTSAIEFTGNYCTGNGLGGSLPSGLCQEEQVGLVDTSQGMWHLRHSEDSGVSFFYGNPGDVPFLGDWDCDGEATPGLFRQSDAYAYLRNSNSQGIADIRFFFGNPSDIPLAGDFNGDGCDTLSIYRPSEARFYIVNALGTNDGGLGPADYSFLFGNQGDKPVVGDWDGDGIDEIGLHRETTGFFYYRNTLTTGIADGQFFFGDPGDRFVAGDWGIVDGKDTPGLFRPSNTTFYFRHTLTEGNADSQLVYGQSEWIPVAGDFGFG